MAKFTVFFKDKPIRSSLFESGVVHIGRDETNDISIDSLAIAPAHAAVIMRGEECIIKQLNSDFPLIVNGEQQKEHPLNNNDTITIGKHHIVYSSSETLLSPPVPTDSINEAESSKLNNALEGHDQTHEANLQVMGGKHIGRLVPLKKTMTRLGRTGNGMVIVTRRADGYFVSLLEPDERITINGSRLGEHSILLKNDDILLIDNVPMQFYMR